MIIPHSDGNPNCLSDEAISRSTYKPSKACSKLIAVAGNSLKMHVLPQGFKRIRHYGLLANCHKKAKLMQCRLALNLPKPDAHVIEEMQAFMLRVKQLDLLHCPNCKDGTMCSIETIPRPPWRNQLSTGPPP